MDRSALCLQHTLSTSVQASMFSSIRKLENQAMITEAYYGIGKMDEYRRKCGWNG